MRKHRPEVPKSDPQSQGKISHNWLPNGFKLRLDTPSLKPLVGSSRLELISYNT